MGKKVPIEDELFLLLFQKILKLSCIEKSRNLKMFGVHE